MFYHRSGTGSWKLYFEPPVDAITLDKAVKGQKLYYTGDITQLKENQLRHIFLENWDCLVTTDFEENIRGLKITNYSRVFFTFVGGLIISENLNNSDNDLPINGWYICFDYGIGKVNRKVFEKIRL